MTADNIANNNVDYIEGNARLDQDRSVIVRGNDGRDRKLLAKTILIATGSRPSRPKNISFDLPGVCDTDTILHRGRVPEDILIVGGGPVGVEFATICHALGAKVTLLDRGTRLLVMMDGEISDRMQDLFRNWGIAVLFGSTAESVAAMNDSLEVKLSTGETLRPDTILFAAGRSANTQGLGLDTAGVALDSRGRIVVDEHFRTSAEGVYAAGDVLGPTLASIAMEQGRAAICYAFGIPFEGTVDPAPVSAVYGMPEVSGAGLTEEQCRERGLDYEVGRSDLERTPRGAIAGRGGLLKLVFLKESRKLVGVHCIGDIASEIIGIGQMVIRCGGTLNTMANMSFNTPTYSYAYKYAAFDGLRRLAATRRTQGATR
jgi:NAD(P) transhydrogenase